MSLKRTIILLVLLTSLQVMAGVYHVGVGDVLSVRVLGEQEFTGAFRVATDGSIDYPYLRQIDVKEQTVEQLKALITAKLKDGYLTDPQVMVEVKEYRSQRVLVLGAVARPGPYVLKEESRVLNIISQAGGLTKAGGKRIVILRNEMEKVQAVDQKRPVVVAKSAEESQSVDAKEAVELEKVTEEANAVEKPVETKERQQNQANLVVVDYYDLVHKGDFSQNVLLRNGDIVNVPRANEVLISGNVGKPGPIKFEDGMTLLQAITLAGDTTPIASPKNTYILRKSKKGDEKIEIRLDKIKEGKMKDYRLKPDDVVVVPESFF